MVKDRREARIPAEEPKMPIAPNFAGGLENIALEGEVDNLVFEIVRCTGEDYEFQFVDGLANGQDDAKYCDSRHRQATGDAIPSIDGKRLFVD
jgi:hypothetical protein